MLKRAGGCGAAATAGSLADLATGAGYRVEPTGELPLLRYVLAVRPAEASPRQ